MPVLVNSAQRKFSPPKDIHIEYAFDSPHGIKKMIVTLENGSTVEAYCPHDVRVNGDLYETPATKPEAKTPIKAGDTVRLKVGGPALVVGSIYHDAQLGATAACYAANLPDIVTHRIPVAALKPLS